MTQTLIVLGAIGLPIGAFLIFETRRKRIHLNIEKGHAEHTLTTHSESSTLLRNFDVVLFTTFLIVAELLYLNAVDSAVLLVLVLLVLGAAAAIVPLAISEDRVLLVGNRGRSYTGHAILPARVYAGDSHPLEVIIRRADFEVPPKGVRAQSTVDGLVFSVHTVDDGSSEIAVDLVAPATTLGGEARQQAPFTDLPATFRWIGHFERSGNHTMTMQIGVIVGDAYQLVGRFDHRVRVNQVDHLTTRQVWIIGGLLGGIPAVVALVRLIAGLSG